MKLLCIVIIFGLFLGCTQEKEENKRELSSKSAAPHKSLRPVAPKRQNLKIINEGTEAGSNSESAQAPRISLRPRARRVKIINEVAKADTSSGSAQAPEVSLRPRARKDSEDSSQSSNSKVRPNFGSSRVRVRPQNDLSYGDELGSSNGADIRYNTSGSLEGQAQAASTEIESPYSYALPGIGRRFNGNCRNFIQSDGSYGEWGKELIEAMRRVEEVNGTSCFFGSDPSGMVKMGQRCVSSESFAARSRESKEHIWVWFWASVAQAESSCDPTAEADGIWNEQFQRFNTAAGLLQLEHRFSTRAANGRDSRFCPHVEANSQSTKFQFECAASIMHDTQCGEFLKNGDSYWQKLRPDRSQIWNLFSSHPQCGG